jgi:translocator protein
MKLKISDIVIPGLVLLTAAAGSLVTSDALGSWYSQINLPSWTPPGSIIGAVWSVLYIMIAIAGILIWRRYPRGPRFKAVAVVFLVNLGLNAGWSYLFFGANWLGGALFEAVIMAATILALVILCWRPVRAAAWLLIPYLAWVSFASYLTYSVWQLNL